VCMTGRDWTGEEEGKRGREGMGSCALFQIYGLPLNTSLILRTNNHTTISNSVFA